MLALNKIRLQGATLLATALLTSLTAASNDLTARAAQDSLQIEWPEPAVSAELVLARPDGTQARFVLAGGREIEVGSSLLADVELENGTYHYEIRFRPLIDEHHQAKLAQARRDGADDLPVGPVIAPKSGSFQILDGVMLFPDSNEPQATMASGGGRDQVIDDDLVVTGGGCFGNDCADGEDFLWAPLKVKMNNPRLTLIDSSSTGSFPAGDWQLRSNDSNDGGANHFSIDWLGTEANTGQTPITTPFRIDADAPTNALRVTAQGQVGLGTATPAVHFQITDGNTPTVRLEQTDDSGFTPQTWDVGGNEANFFVRDATNGSTLPFRIRAGAPTSSIDIQATGNVGIGTTSPAAKLHVANGDLRVDGSVYQLSSRALKTDFVDFDPARLLELVGSLDLGTWRYLSSTDEAAHFGPAAEDFHSAFGLGSNEQSISIADMAGVALGAAQALKVELDSRDAHIADLEGRLDRLERALEAQLQQAER